GGRLDVTSVFANLHCLIDGAAAKLQIYPLVGEMARRPEGGAGPATLRHDGPMQSNRRRVQPGKTFLAAIGEVRVGCGDLARRVELFYLLQRQSPSNGAEI